MAYKVRQGDSWQTLQNQFPNLQSLNPTIKNIKPGMVLQTPFQYGLQVNAPAVGGRGSQAGGRPTYTPQNQVGSTTPFYPPTQAPKPTPIRPLSYYDGTHNTPAVNDKVGDMAYVNEWQNSVEGKAQFAANAILMAAQKQATSTPEGQGSWIAPAQGEPGYDRWEALKSVVTASQWQKKRNRVRNTFQGAGDVNIAGDQGSFGQFNWRI
jgi:hypothetical protein